MTVATLTVWTLAALGAASADGAPLAALTIEEALQLALANNERAAIAKESEARAEAVVVKARSQFLPNLTLVASYSRRLYQARDDTDPAGDADPDAVNALGTVTVQLFDATAFPLYRRAKLDREATTLSADEERRALSFEVAHAFLTVLSLQEVRAAAERRLEFARTSLADAEARRTAGLASVNEVTRVALELASAERALTNARGEHDLSRLQLAYLIAREVNGPLAPPERLLAAIGAVATASADRQALIGEAERAREDLAAAKTRVEALRAYASEPLLRLVPSLSLFGQASWGSQGDITRQDLSRGRSLDGVAGVQLSWLLFDGGLLWGDRAERVALANIAELETRLLDRGLTLEVESALVGLANGGAAVSQAEVASAAALQNADETRELFRQGLTSALAVADASLRLFEAEVSLTGERYGQARSYLDLRYAMGLAPLAAEDQR